MPLAIVKAQQNATLTVQGLQRQAHPIAPRQSVLSHIAKPRAATRVKHLVGNGHKTLSVLVKHGEHLALG
jgi:hypothetical protein